MSGESRLAQAGRGLVRALDARLRHSQKIFAYSEDPRCILRLSLVPARMGMSLRDGTVVAPGDPLGVLHFWNEHIPPMPAEGPDMSWARRMISDTGFSLRLLTRYLTAHPELAQVSAFGSDLGGFLRVSDLDLGSRFFGRLGFEVERPGSPKGVWARFAAFWENVYSWMLIWTYNPASVRGKTPLNLERFGIWMSRAALEQRYPPPERGADTQAGAAEPALATSHGGTQMA